MSSRVNFAILLFISYLGFSAWVYTVGTDRKSAIEEMNSDAYSGKLLYQELNCSACHQIFGLGGYLGPDLTNVISQTGKGENYVAAFLKYGSRQMPDYRLDSLQVREIISFLSYVDRSARMERAALGKL